MNQEALYGYLHYKNEDIDGRLVTVSKITDAYVDVIFANNDRRAIVAWGSISQIDIISKQEFDDEIDFRKKKAIGEDIASERAEQARERYMDEQLGVEFPF